MSRHRGGRRKPSLVSLDGSYRDLERKGSMEGSIRAFHHRLRPCCVHGSFAGAPRRGPIDRSGDEETRASWNGLGFWRLDAGPASRRFKRGHQERQRPWGKWDGLALGPTCGVQGKTSRWCLACSHRKDAMGGDGRWTRERSCMAFFMERLSMGSRKRLRFRSTRMPSSPVLGGRFRSTTKRPCAHVAPVGGLDWPFHPFLKEDLPLAHGERILDRPHARPRAPRLARSSSGSRWTVQSAQVRSGGRGTFRRAGQARFRACVRMRTAA